MNKASIRVESLVIPTYPEPAKEEMPLFAEYRVHQRSTGRPYPNKATLDVDRQHRQDKTYTVVHMENEYLDVLIMPAIGGKIYAAKDKTTGYDFFYRQHVVKPGLIGAFGSWVSGGVEFNWRSITARRAITRWRRAKTAASSAGSPSTTRSTG